MLRIKLKSNGITSIKVRIANPDQPGSATALDYGARIYDPRIARYISTDPKASKQNNPYQFADTTKQSKNNPKEKITGKKNKP